MSPLEDLALELWPGSPLGEALTAMSAYGGAVKALRKALDPAVLLPRLLSAMDLATAALERSAEWGDGPSDVVFKHEGWAVTVRVGGGSDWRYVDRIDAPDGRVWQYMPDGMDADHEGIRELPESVSNWMPSNRVRWGLEPTWRLAPMSVGGWRIWKGHPYPKGED